ncbi:MAG TPA: hypothetical protein VD766_05545 [Solirubrobacterales bacterium]|nr:hypothetical protein [Solirubrobacterales bacterium]
MIDLRKITALALLCALAAAASAAGRGNALSSYTGSFEAGGQVSLRLSPGGGNVSHISIDGITAECRRGSATLDYNIDGGTPVLEDRSFAVRSRDGKAKAFVKGRFSSDYESVKGAARVHGKIFAGKPRCDSERQKFKGKVSR